MGLLNSRPCREPVIPSRSGISFPFSLAEVVSSRPGAPTVAAMELRRMWDTLLIRGGYPEAFLSREERDPDGIGRA